MIRSFVIIAGLVAFAFAGQQKIRVKGKLFCPTNANDHKNVLIKVYDKDIGPDDKMGETRTNADGSFELEAVGDEMSNVDARLNIYHDCNDGKPCQRKWKIDLPDKYINRGTLDIGKWNLELIMDDEDRDCLH